jgi:serine protease Do
MLRNGDGEELAWFGQAEGAYLGVQLSDLDEAKAEYFEVKNGEGALVTEVVADSPAAAAGFEIYDVIVELGDESIADADEAVAYVRGREADETVKVTVLRKGKKKTFEATLGERPADRFAVAAPRGHRDLRFFPQGRMQEFHEQWAPLHEGRNEDIENLRADIEELRALIEELKNNR